jgi:6,7-dimethyl-8-ribityllumazine synthase
MGAWRIRDSGCRASDGARYELLIALGAVIRGDTAHFEYVAGPCADGIARVQHDTGLPIGFAVLTTENIAQATERSGPGAGNKGEEAAIGAIETWHVLQAIRAPK